jgi:glycine betaine/choline ABC-type transport system substrate-binding protein
MTRKEILIIVTMFLFFSPNVDACVGKVLNIGVVNSPEGQLFGEMISALVNERTGTTVKVQVYRNTQDLYEAVRMKQVDISIENTTRALHLLNKPAESDVKKAYEVVKTAYEKEKGLVWLKPFGFLNGNGGEPPSYTATILRVDVLNNFPALPRVINKLGSAVSDEAYEKLIKSMRSGEKPKDVARNFLKSKKLI